MKIFKIVLTGGPHSGKTTILKNIKDYFSSHKEYAVITVPETASELINNGVKPNYVQNIYDFQDLIFKRQFVKEQTVEQAARLFQDKETVIIIYDRGLLDNKAYLKSQEEFDHILMENSCSELAILDKYDLIINLKSTAGSNFGYDLETNEARFESECDAVSVDERTTQAWLGHKNFKIVQPTETIEEKAMIVLDLIDILIKKSRNMIIEEDIRPQSDFDINAYNDENSKLISVLEHELDFEIASGFKYFIYKRKYKECTSYVMEISKKVGNIKEVECIKQISESLALQYINQLGIKNIYEKKELYFYQNGSVCRVDIDSESAKIINDFDLTLYPESMQSSLRLLKNFENRNNI